MRVLTRRPGRAATAPKVAESTPCAPARGPTSAVVVVVVIVRRAFCKRAARPAILQSDLAVRASCDDERNTAPAADRVTDSVMLRQK